MTTNNSAVTPVVTSNESEQTIREVEAFFTKYATLASDYYVLPLALWAAMTHTWPTFDTLPYLVITAHVKRAGKTRMMELLAMLSANSGTFSPDSTASMFRSLSADGAKPTMFIDEAEKLNQEGHPAREFLNKGYKRGQTIPRFVGGEVVDFECFGPKCFVLIGDVYDTLRDRSIVVTMRRRNPVEAANSVAFRLSQVEPEAESLREQLSNLIKERQSDIDDSYASFGQLSFLNDRDEEIWMPLFAIARVLCPSRLDELTRAAVDIATEKTNPKRKHTELLDEEEKKADDEEAGVLLLRDMLKLTDGKEYIKTADLLTALKAIPTSPWRTFRGPDGLTAEDCAALLDGKGLRPKRIRLMSGRAAKGPGAFARGYKRDEIEAAAHLCGLL